MAEYIEREAAIAAIKKDIMGGLNYERILNSIPAADVQPVKHGKWVYDENGMDWNIPAWRCSECGVKNDSIPPYIRTNQGLKEVNPYLFSGSNYCPNCGAKMDGET